MAIQRNPEVHAVLVHLSNGSAIEGFIPDESKLGDWVAIARNKDLTNSTFVNRAFITHMELSAISEPNEPAA